MNGHQFAETYERIVEIQVKKGNPKPTLHDFAKVLNIPHTTVANWKTRKGNKGIKNEEVVKLMGMMERGELSPFADYPGNLAEKKNQQMKKVIHQNEKMVKLYESNITNLEEMINMYKERDDDKSMKIKSLTSDLEEMRAENKQLKQELSKFKSNRKKS